MISRLLLAIAVVAVPQTWGDWPSVWQANKAASYSIEGRIKAIMINEEQNQIFVHLESSEHPGQVQTVRVCNQDLGSDFRSFQQSEKMALLRQAFAKGDRVQVSYASSFDRCLSSITYLAPEKPAANAKSL